MKGKDLHEVEGFFARLRQVNEGDESNSWCSESDLLIRGLIHKIEADEFV